jgi:hypothetical protein
MYSRSRHPSQLSMITREVQNRGTVFSVVTCANERRLRLVARDFICGASGSSCSIGVVVKLPSGTAVVIFFLFRLSRPEPRSLEALEACRHWHWQVVTSSTTYYTVRDLSQSPGQLVCCTECRTTIVVTVSPVRRTFMLLNGLTRRVRRHTRVEAAS